MKKLKREIYYSVFDLAWNQLQKRAKNKILEEISGDFWDYLTGDVTLFIWNSISNQRVRMMKL